MARIRTLKPEFYLDDEVALHLSIPARYAFQGLWTLADRAGRLEDRPLRIKAQLFPYDAVDIDALLDEIERGGYIVRYRAAGHALLQIRSFEKHQRPHPKEPASPWPEPTPTDLAAADHGAPRPVAAGPATAPAADSRPDPAPAATPTPVGTTCGCSDPVPAPQEADPADPAVLVFPIVGDPTGEWSLLASKLAEWDALYPAMDVLGELRRARQWLLDTPAKRKTSKGMTKFLGSWLSRSVDTGRFLRRDAPASAPAIPGVRRGVVPGTPHPRDPERIWDGQGYKAKRDWLEAKVVYVNGKPVPRESWEASACAP